MGTQRLHELWTKSISGANNNPVASTPADVTNEQETITNTKKESAAVCASSSAEYGGNTRQCGAGVKGKVRLDKADKVHKDSTSAPRNKKKRAASAVVAPTRLDIFKS